MFHKTAAKLCAWLILLFSLIFLLLNTTGIRYIDKKITDDRISILYEEAQLISTEYLTNYYTNNTSIVNIRTQLGTVDTFLNVRILTVTKDGNVIIDTQEQNVAGYANLNDVAPGLFDNIYIKNTTLNGMLDEPVLAVCYTISSNFNTQGYVVILEPMKNIQQSSISTINIINVTLLINCGILIITFIFLSANILSPIRKLNKGVHEYANGNFQYQLPIKSSDEFGELAASINYMANELANLEEYQKKFIANISHDFRSPLTSIKGYAEAIKDGTIPYELQNKYLDIILFETDRLTKLTENLLTLNNIKNNGTLLNIVSFDINYMIKKTVATFEGICTKKRISFQLIFESDHAVVCGDEDKIRQVLYNLIDNAIKFSPNNSSIQIMTEEKNDKLFVSIKDHGIGIPADSLYKIWERFYKTDQSRGKDKKGTGLGLSIVKEIINAHDENITVVSTTDVGTEFVFTLPMSEEEIG